MNNWLTVWQDDSVVSEEEFGVGLPDRFLIMLALRCYQFSCIRQDLRHWDLHPVFGTKHDKLIFVILIFSFKSMSPYFITCQVKSNEAAAGAQAPMTAAGKQAGFRNTGMFSCIFTWTFRSLLGQVALRNAERAKNMAEKLKSKYPQARWVPWNPWILKIPLKSFNPKFLWP